MRTIVQVKMNWPQHVVSSIHHVLHSPLYGRLWLVELSELLLFSRKAGLCSEVEAGGFSKWRGEGSGRWLPPPHEGQHSHLQFQRTQTSSTPNLFSKLIILESALIDSLNSLCRRSFNPGTSMVALYRELLSEMPFLS